MESWKRKEIESGTKGCAAHDADSVKNAGKWDFLAKMFNTKEPTFEKLIKGFMDVVVEDIYEMYVTKLEARYTMDGCCSGRHLGNLCDKAGSEVHL